LSSVTRWAWILFIPFTLQASGCTPAKLASTPPQPVIVNTELPVIPTSTLLPDATSPAMLPITEPELSSLPPTPTPLPCGTDWCVLPGRFYFERPIGPQGNQQVERYYSYGSTQGGTRDPHHGVEFTNPQGTPVLAAADGRVIVAGTDHKTEYGWGLDFYGNLVVIEHALPGIALPLYTLYAHLSEVAVEVGQAISAGEVLGAVGSTGSAQGSHLHFEVRLGGNTYQDTRNPELWLNPCDTCGILVGTILDNHGTVQRFPDIKLEQITGEKPAKPVYIDSYDDPLLRGDDLLQEVFAIGDLPAGTYQITFSPYGVAQRIQVQVLPGQITKVTLHTNR